MGTIDNPDLLTSDFVTDDELLAIFKAVMRSHPDGIEEEALFAAIEKVEQGVATARLFLQTYAEMQQEDTHRARKFLAGVSDDMLADVHRVLHEFDHVVDGTMRVEFYDGGFDFVAA